MTSRTFQLVQPLLPILLAAAPLAAQDWQPLFPNVPPGTPALVTLNELNSDELYTTVDVTIFGFWWESVQGGDGNSYLKLDFPGLGTIGQVGAPDLPAVRLNIAAGAEPDSGGVLALSDVTIFNSIQFQGITPLPTYVEGVDEDFDPTWDPGPGDTVGSEPVFSYDASIYQGANVWPASYSVQDADIVPMLGPIQGATVPIYPVSFVPAAVSGGIDTIDIVSAMSITFEMQASEAQATEITKIKEKEAEVFFFNWEETKFYWPSNPTDYFARYLIVAQQMWWPTLKPFETHKKMQGYQVSTIAAPADVDAIRDIIASWYTLGDPGLDHYVLLVGDTDQIPLAFLFQNGTTVRSDDAYGCVGSLDTSKEVHVGRISVDNTDSLGWQLQKIIDYDLSPGPGNYGRALLVSHKEDAPQKYTGSHTNVMNASYNTSPLFIPLFGENPVNDNSDVFFYVNDGVGVVAYRGHGSTTTWSDWNSYGEDLHKNSLGPQLVNLGMRPVVWAVTCTNANIDFEGSTTQDSISEVWMEVANGGVASYGATRTTSTTPNHHLNEELFRIVYDLGVTTHAKAIELAEASVWTQWPGHHNPWAYLLLGDPSMTIRTGWVEQLGFQWAPSEIMLDEQPGSLFLTVTSSDDTYNDVLVSVYKESFLTNQPDEILGAYWADGNNDVVVPLPLSTPGTLYLSVRDADGDQSTQAIDVGMGFAWEDLGQGMSGDWGPARLAGTGNLYGGNPWSLLLASARPNATAWLCLGFSELDAPFKGGVLVPDINPPGLFLALPTDADGNLVISATWPDGLPGGVPFIWQYWIVDDTGPVGFVSSNAVKGTTPL